MRPRLKSDTFYIPIEDGVYFRNNERAFVMKGKTLATWMERLAPLLDGQYDLAYLSGNLAPEKRAMVLKLVNILVEQGFARDVSTDRPHTLSADIQQVYAPAITFIDYHLDSGASRFQHFLDLPVLTIGSGDALVALAHALLETGNRRIHLLDTGEENTDHKRIADLLAMLQTERDAGLTLSTITISDWHNNENLKRTLASFKTVIYFSTGASLSLVEYLARLCYQAGVLFLPAVLLGKQIIIGPTQRSGTPGCWQCFWRRWQAAQSLPIAEESGALFPLTSTRPVKPGATALGLTANLLAFECFKQGTDIHNGTLDGQIYVLELERLESAMHRVYPHPLCTTCTAPYAASPDQLEAEIAALQQRTTSQQAGELAWHAEQWTDACTGIFTHIHEQDLSQLPLVQSQITVAAPFATEQPVAGAAGFDYREVRELAVRKAVSYYLESLADTRRAYTASLEQLRSHYHALAPQRFFGWIEQAFSAQQPAAWLWAWQLDEGCPAFVPAGAVYPRALWDLHAGTRLFRPDIPGTGVGASWDEALARGLLEIVQAIDLAAYSLYDPTRLIARSACAGDSICAAYFRMLDILGCEVWLVDQTGSSGLPCIATYRDGRYSGMAAHWNAITAVREALKAAVLAAQIEHFPGPGDRPSQEPAASDLAGASSGEALPASLAEETDYQQATCALLERSDHLGWKILVVPIGADSTVATVMRYALRVLAARGETAPSMAAERSRT